MQKSTLALIAFACLGFGLAAAPAQAQEESYTAQIPVSNDASGHLQTVNFTITKWSTQDDIKALGKILKEKGQDALLEELKKMDSGRIRTPSETGNQIAVAEKWQEGDKTVITMIAARRISMSEAKRRGIARDYPFAFMSVTLNSAGEGSGKLVDSAKIKYDEKAGTYRLDPYGKGAIPVTTVKPLK